MISDATYPVFPIFAFLGFILSLVPLPWHLQAWNSGTVYFMMWTALACLNQFVNSVVWAGNFRNPAPVWCDICAVSCSLEGFTRNRIDNPTSHQDYACSRRWHSRRFPLHQPSSIQDCEGASRLHFHERGQPTYSSFVGCCADPQGLTLYRDSRRSLSTPLSVLASLSSILSWVSRPALPPFRYALTPIA